MDATQRSKAVSFAVSLYPLSFFANTPFKIYLTNILVISSEQFRTLLHALIYACLNTFFCVFFQMSLLHKIMLITNILIFNKIILCFNNFKLRFNGNKEEAATRNEVMNLKDIKNQKFQNIFFKWPRSLIFFFMHHLFNFYKINKISFTIYYKIFNLFINEFIRLKVWDRSIQYYSRGLVRISQGGIIHAFLHSAIHLFTYSFINPYYCKLD